MARDECGHGNLRPKCPICDRDEEINRLRNMLADCYRLAGEDTDGMEDWRLAEYATDAVHQQRLDYDEACEENERLRGQRNKLARALHRLDDLECDPDENGIELRKWLSDDIPDLAADIAEGRE